VKRFVLVGIIALLVATPAVAQKPIGEPFTLTVGASELVGPAGLRVGFDAIVGDSRCPRNVTCVWEGVATAGVWAELPGLDRETLLLSTMDALTFVQERPYSIYRIRLLDVAPYPLDPGGIDPADYVITVVVNLGGLPTEASTWGAIKALYQ
jgi:hypothetical protein